jgi:hypothetical protein
MAPAPSLDLTVVVAVTDADRSINQCLAAMAAACDGLSAEILVVGGSTVTPAFAARMTHVRADRSALAPELWAAGIERAQGSLVALTTGHMIVSPEWARALIGANASSAAIGGPLELHDTARVSDWAVFYLRYSAFLASHWTDGPTAGELAGDNAAYRLTDLRRHAAAIAGGFWEVDFHRLLRADALTLWRTSAARASFGRSFHLWTFVKQRFSHGFTFGRSDVEQGRRSRIGLVLKAPLVPAVLAWRAARRVRDTPHVRRFVAALPMFLVFASAWAAGEAAGAISAPGHASA